jgi:threonine dehydratase
MRELTLEDVRSAAAVVGQVIRPTPLIRGYHLGDVTGAEVYLKPENLQRTGSFKIRGAYTKIQSLSAEERSRGVIASSAGNHAQGVALAATKAGIRSTIVMPETAPLTKVLRTRYYGAQVVLEGEAYESAYARALEIQEAEGLTFIHPFDDPLVIAGQGTIGLEILEELPDVGTTWCRSAAAGSSRASRSPQSP